MFEDLNVFVVRAANKAVFKVHNSLSFSLSVGVTWFTFEQGRVSSARKVGRAFHNSRANVQELSI